MGTHEDRGKCVRCDADTVRIISTKIQTRSRKDRKIKRFFPIYVIPIKNYPPEIYVECKYSNYWYYFFNSNHWY